MTREDFIQQFILTRTSYKRELKDLLKEAQEAYEFSVKQDY